MHFVDTLIARRLFFGLAQSRTSRGLLFRVFEFTLAIYDVVGYSF